MRTQESGEEQEYGRCRSCKRLPDELLFDEHIVWALCTRCRVGWWAMFSYDGWGLSEAELGEVESALAGWDLGDEKLEANMAGTRGELAFADFLGLPWREKALNDLRQGFQDGHGTPVHVRTTRFERAHLIIAPNDPDDHIYVQVVGDGSTYRPVGWKRGHDARQLASESSAGRRMKLR